VIKMLKYCLKTTYFRGRGPQRIRKVILLETTATDTYTAGTGLIDGDDNPVGAPSLTTLTDLLAPAYGLIGGGPIMGRIRDCVIRTIEPRFHGATDFVIPVVAGAYSFVNAWVLADNVIAGRKRVQIKIFHVPAAGGFMESGSLNTAAVGNGVQVPIEIEYTSHSGAEG
jgi:hypothetical protein